MVEHKFDTAQLSEVLKAVSDPTRRSILTSLVQEGPTRVTDLAAYYKMSLNSVSKHIKVLEAAGLVGRKTTGRVHWISAELGPVRLIDEWFSELRSIWEMRLEKLDAVIQENAAMSELELTVKRTINAPADKLFEAWLDPKTMAQFMLPMQNMPAPVVKNDPQVGGEFSIVMMAGEDEIPHHGVYKEIDRHKRLVFTWLSPFSVDDSTVTLRFMPVSDGQTEVELHHIRFPSEESRDNHTNGWTQILAELEALATR